jgi:hypothetical protein
MTGQPSWAGDREPGDKPMCYVMSQARKSRTAYPWMIDGVKCSRETHAWQATLHPEASRVFDQMTVMSLLIT